MKPCPHCGKELPQEMQFCPYCMEKLITETVIGDTPTRRRRWWLWLIGMILLLLLLSGIWLWPRLLSPIKEKAASVGGSITATTTTTATVSAVPSTTTTTATADTTTTMQNPSSTDTTAPSTGTSTAGSTSTSASSSASPCATGHDWQSITQTVHVDEVGHYEPQTVEKQVTLFRCALCYQEYGKLDDYYTHFDGQHDGDSLQSIFRDRYETVTEYREVQQDVWVVDTPAHDENITTGRRCRVCGKTETYNDKE